MRNINLLIGRLDLILLDCFLEIEEEVTILSLCYVLFSGPLDDLQNT